MSGYFHKKGWVDGYSDRPRDLKNLGIVRPDDAKAYLDGWREGEKNRLTDQNQPRKKEKPRS